MISDLEIPKTKSMYLSLDDLMSGKLYKQWKRNIFDIKKTNQKIAQLQPIPP